MLSNQEKIKKINLYLKEENCAWIVKPLVFLHLTSFGFMIMRNWQITQLTHSLLMNSGEFLIPGFLRILTCGQTCTNLWKIYKMRTLTTNNKTFRYPKWHHLERSPKLCMNMKFCHHGSSYPLKERKESSSRSMHMSIINKAKWSFCQIEKL